jgi:hypothetical protein
MVVNIDKNISHFQNYTGMLKDKWNPPPSTWALITTTTITTTTQITNYNSARLVKISIVKALQFQER